MLFSHKFVVLIGAVLLASSLVAAEAVHKPDSEQSAPAFSLHDGAKASPAGMKGAEEAKHSSMHSGKPPASKPSAKPPSGKLPSGKPQSEHSKRAEEAANHDSRQPPKHESSHKPEHGKN